MQYSNDNLASFLAWCVDAQEYIAIPAQAKPVLDSLIAVSSTDEEDIKLAEQAITAFLHFCKGKNAGNEYDDEKMIKLVIYDDMSGHIGDDYSIDDYIAFESLKNLIEQLGLSS